MTSASSENLATLTLLSCDIDQSIGAAPARQPLWRAVPLQEASCSALPACSRAAALVKALPLPLPLNAARLLGCQVVVGTVS